MGDSEEDCQRAGCTRYQRLVSSDLDCDTRLGILLRSSMRQFGRLPIGSA